MPEEQRLEVVKALKPVDEAVLGDATDKYKVIEEHKPDVVALGSDQEEDVERLEYELGKRGLNPKIVRVSKAKGKLYKSSSILEHVCSSFSEE